MDFDDFRLARGLCIHTFGGRKPDMLVMSRRKEQKIVFPGLGITVTLLDIKGNTARLGVDAPRDISILREEIAGRKNAAVVQERLDLHEIRNVLNSVNLFVAVYGQQMKANQLENAAATFMKLVEYLETQTQQGIVGFNVEHDDTRDISGRVMIVEDEPDQREMLSSFLALQGLDVTAHVNGQSALQELRKGAAPEIVLLDWSMPEFGGPWLVAKILGEFGEKSPKLFVVSGSEALTATHRSGVDAWLAKPLNHDALLARIRAVCSAC